MTVSNKSEMKQLESKLMEEEKDLLAENKERKRETRERVNNNDAVMTEKKIPLDVLYNMNFIQE